MDGDEDMDKTQEEQYRPFCQNLYTQVLLFRFCTKQKVTCKLLAKKYALRKTEEYKMLYE